MEEMPARPSRPVVLVVDDSLLVQRMIRECFEPAGYDVRLATNGLEALTEMRAMRPDVIISDIIMPVMDGWEFCEKVRKNPETADIPFLFLTAVQEIPERIRGLRMGADDYITKPFAREELLARVERILARMERLQKLDLQSGTALSGHTIHLAITDLLQILSLNGKTGALTLTDAGGAAARIFFREGRIVHAVLGSVMGQKALFRLLDWQEAHFELDPVREPSATETIQESTSNLLMEALTHNDELRQVRATLPALAHRYRLAPGVKRMVARLGLEAPEKSVLPEFSEIASLEEVLDRSPLADLRIGKILVKLLENGLLEPASMN
jgi:DNA-binding response OmpR family regulator